MRLCKVKLCKGCVMPWFCCLPLSPAPITACLLAHHLPFLLVPAGQPLAFPTELPVLLLPCINAGST